MVEYLDIYTEEIETLRKKESELLVKYVAECTSFCGQKICESERIALAITRIMRHYEDAYIRYHGGHLVSTKHVYNTRIALTQKIQAQYREDILQNFIAFCIECAEGSISLPENDNDISRMIDMLLSMRPDPVFYPRDSYWKLVWEGED